MSETMVIIKYPDGSSRVATFEEAVLHRLDNLEKQIKELKGK